MPKVTSEAHFLSGHRTLASGGLIGFRIDAVEHRIEGVVKLGLRMEVVKVRLLALPSRLWLVDGEPYEAERLTYKICEGAWG